MCDLMWSDPDDDIQGCACRALDPSTSAWPSRWWLVAGGWLARCSPRDTMDRASPRAGGISARGAGYVFGPDIADQFLYANNLELIARSHQVRTTLTTHTTRILPPTSSPTTLSNPMSICVGALAGCVRGTFARGLRGGGTLSRCVQSQAAQWRRFGHAVRTAGRSLHRSAPSTALLYFLHMTPTAPLCVRVRGRGRGQRARDDSSGSSPWRATSTFSASSSSPSGRRPTTATVAATWPPSSPSTSSRSSTSPSSSRGTAVGGNLTASPTNIMCSPSLPPHPCWQAQPSAQDARLRVAHARLLPLSARRRGAPRRAAVQGGARLRA
jgi:hypothetical protein